MLILYFRYSLLFIRVPSPSCHWSLQKMSPTGPCRRDPYTGNSSLDFLSSLPQNLVHRLPSSIQVPEFRPSASWTSPLPGLSSIPPTSSSFTTTSDPLLPSRTRGRGRRTGLVKGKCGQVDTQMINRGGARIFTQTYRPSLPGTTGPSPSGPSCTSSPPYTGLYP